MNSKKYIKYLNFNLLIYIDDRWISLLRTKARPTMTAHDLKTSKPPTWVRSSPPSLKIRPIQISQSGRPCLFRPKNQTSSNLSLNLLFQPSPEERWPVPQPVPQYPLHMKQRSNILVRPYPYGRNRWPNDNETVIRH